MRNGLHPDVQEGSIFQESADKIEIQVLVQVHPCLIFSQNTYPYNNVDFTY